MPFFKALQQLPVFVAHKKRAGMNKPTPKQYRSTYGTAMYCERGGLFIA